MAEEATNPEEAIEQHRIEIDASKLTVLELHTALCSVPVAAKHRVVQLPAGLPGVGAGLDRAIDLQIDGCVGPFAFMLFQKGCVEITQNADRACGHSLHSGNILVRGDCGSHVAAYSIGGLVTVHGRAGDYAGFGLSGGEVVIRSRCGVAAGAGMRSGTLVVGNGAGEKLGQGMTGGTIFVRGTVGSLASGVSQVPVKEADSLRLGLLLARAGLKAKQTEFHAFRANPLMA